MTSIMGICSLFIFSSLHNIQSNYFLSYQILSYYITNYLTYLYINIWIGIFYSKLISEK